MILGGQESKCEMSGIEDEPTDLALDIGGTEIDNTGAATAEGIFRQLQEEIFSNWKVGLLHGRLPGDEKIRVLNAFAAGEIDLLVATTVVEVGIDIPNATVMTILDADRLGLAQLHQLRGRVSRGVHPGYVCAVASAGASAADNERLNAFEKSNDGFALAELDLKMRPWKLTWNASEWSTAHEDRGFNRGCGTVNGSTAGCQRAFGAGP